MISADLDALQAPYKPLELELAQLFLELAGEEEELNALQLQTLISIALEPAWAKTVPTPLPGALGPSHVMAGHI